ncbi:RagB/SusD family nutrient uptake outer membrane protein [Mongoliibacter ruber]|uniref:SusD-like starch-binding protein associating with outer membrane n=1 Tax=Mongoliibacter ruber TaxID=1750599 RepID=A0A2T0WVF5_9BACT|nr:RagB/SusD family nutrient uptake outer membrane protein [Mongoliibacter ruber]PRY90683.1 SusD-like starch-binding protein associating with outer membrane [Mongoliibacter ruber]
MKNLKISILLTSMFFLGACHESFLDERAFDIITESNFFTNQNDAITVTNSIYQSLYGNYTTNLLQLNEYPTEAVTTRLELNSSQGRWDTWQFQVGDFSGIYGASYLTINRANILLDNIERIDMDIALKERLKGEALFLRALSYFNLVRVFGGVPIRVTSTVGVENLELPRSSAEEVYELVIDDLNQAAEWLTSKSALTGNNKGRANKTAAYTLLGKTYLTRASDPSSVQSGDYQRAIDALNNAITVGDSNLLTDYTAIFEIGNENNEEIIFDIQRMDAPDLGGNLTPLLGTAVTNELFQIPWHDYLANVDFYKSFSDGDSRRPATFYDRMQVPESAGGGIVYFDPNLSPIEGSWRRADNDEQVPASLIDVHVPGFRKFVDMGAIQANRDRNNYVILRYSDVYLMMAEAISGQNNGPTPQAFEYLNRVRRRAYGVDIYSPNPDVDLSGLNPVEFTEALYRERRKEFVIEGHGWFDGKRMFDIFRKVIVESASSGGSLGLNNRPKTVIEASRIADPRYFLMPFGLNLFERNSLLTQNPGWE